MRPHGGADWIGHGATLEDALADAWVKSKSGKVVVTQLEWEKGGVLFAGVEVTWPKGKPAILTFEEPKEQATGEWSHRAWAAEQVSKTCLTEDEQRSVLDRFMETRQDLDDSEVIGEPEELSAADAFAREHEDDETPEEPGEEATPEHEAPVIPDEDMETVGAADLEGMNEELVAA
jgi:hypothetical protein